MPTLTLTTSHMGSVNYISTNPMTDIQVAMYTATSGLTTDSGTVLSVFHGTTNGIPYDSYGSKQIVSRFDLAVVPVGAVLLSATLTPVGTYDPMFGADVTEWPDDNPGNTNYRWAVCDNTNANIAVADWKKPSGNSALIAPDAAYNTYGTLTLNATGLSALQTGMDGNRAAKFVCSSVALINNEDWYNADGTDKRFQTNFWQDMQLALTYRTNPGGSMLGFNF